MADFDLFVIGAGSGGVRAARVASAHGAKVAIAEEYRVGGTCVIRGCVPKKLLVYGAHFAEDLDDAAMFGWDVPEKRFDWSVLRDNVLSEVTRLEKAYGETLSNHDVTIFAERAELAGPNAVRLASGKTVTADKINKNPAKNIGGATQTRLDWVGRNHGRGPIDKRRTNFLYVDGHVENKLVEETCRPFQWGRQFYGAKGGDRVLQLP